MKQTAFDAAEADHNIVSRHYSSRRMTCISVCKSTYIFVRKFILQCIRHLVHEPHHDAGITSVSADNGLTGFALTLARLHIVELLHRIDHEVRILTHGLAHALDADLQHVRIRKTELVCATLTVVKAEIFRMRLEIFIRRNMTGHGMNSPIPLCSTRKSSSRFLAWKTGEVVSQTGREYRIGTWSKHTVVTHYKRGRLVMTKLRK